MGGVSGKMMGSGATCVSVMARSIAESATTIAMLTSWKGMCPPFDKKSCPNILAHVMAWCRPVTSHYLNRWWLKHFWCWKYSGVTMSYSIFKWRRVASEITVHSIVFSTACWSQQIESQSSILLALCKGNPSANSGCPSKGRNAKDPRPWRPHGQWFIVSP